ncbi:hypothetical protein CcaverHIS002_0308940 [Cutaneotrichosporon cavernicola]|uniref:protein-tyrosine-phosphatase n=1 Tax=Cutaneotrichosporon cavernicola TaxID=279322 RepID=A0AA48I6V6_9TREE|nr:uncharacterized protein CcaverHIS019_0308790 [Cutaneotrichosporon cavernicola]BEI83026.1 hypothetical protein CcaverHIS002_0308940 [Cutaneotrichosporon cavernicola]BEI90809.1 hypothetical protein CcaverHIS019_0308790 [Cutaneotrichosporon cavernicola]BEI98588.1 hypothetical protein CcaverHIS631_0308870 [Cutaneotrichosporon cavernicola]BEJ06357.1 hypothetical protein CcaverHIS641_0308790 [Cutaneotrichosporon cavernicola]
MLSRSASLRGTKLPQMSNLRDSGLDAAPADALKPDEQAIDDVFAQVKETGTLEGAARRLAELAAAEEGPGTLQHQRRHQAWMDDPEEAAYLAQQQQQEEEEEEVVVEHLNEVIDGLWIGDLFAAMDADGLKERGITNVVSLLRPPLQFAPDFAVFAIMIDDAPETDILRELPSAVAWIAEALQRRAGHEPDQRGLELQNTPETKAGGVLVHCQAGMSRSATVTAAFLMRELRLDPVEAVTFLRDRRSVVDPSDTFWHQLGLYYLADGRMTRQWYLSRTTDTVMNDGRAPSTEHMAVYPSTPTPSQPATPAGGHRRKVRCKMCRQHLALREHMMDHILDQAPLSRPRTPSNFSLPGPLTGLNLSITTDDDALDIDDDEPAPKDQLSRRPSVASDVINPLTGLPASRSRRASLASETGGVGRARSRSLLGLGPDGLTMTRANSVSADEDKEGKSSEDISPTKPSLTRAGRPILDADQLAARLPPQLAALRTGGVSTPSTTDASPVDKPAGRRRASSGLQFTSSMPNMSTGGLTGPPPILANPKCSGYFVEPLTWMEPVLANGSITGKLVCPNPKCGVKIGNYDWAGAQCGCKDWVTPGFCLSRSKVEEVW